MSKSPIVEAELPIHLSTQEGYDRWAEIYDVEENPLVGLEEPLVEQLLGNLKGLRVADVGCGTGRHAVRMAAAGAKVDAIDFASGMLEKARAKTAGLPIQFTGHDLTEPLPFPDGSFDRVLCALVLDHIANLRELFGEMRRICRPDGFIVVSIMHPAMMLKGVQARFRDPTTGQEIRPQSHANQISDYVKAALESGLTIDHMSEHTVDESLAERIPRAAKYLGWPLLLLMRLTIAER